MLKLLKGTAILLVRGVGLIGFVVTVSYLVYDDDTVIAEQSTWLGNRLGEGQGSANDHITVTASI